MTKRYPPRARDRALSASSSTLTNGCVLDRDRDTQLGISGLWLCQVARIFTHLLSMLDFQTNEITTYYKLRNYYELLKCRVWALVCPRPNRFRNCGPSGRCMYVWIHVCMHKMLGCMYALMCACMYVHVDMDLFRHMHTYVYKQ